jgi:uncharacterized protein YndB with AHSA1/START domain
MGTWTAQTEMVGLPEEVMAMLTRPDAIARWAPIPFELVDFDRDRLRSGDTVRVCGVLAGRSLEFEVEVAEAEDGRLALVATGPIQIDVEYVTRAVESGSEIRARVDVSGRGLMGRVLAGATDALLAAGALDSAVGRIASELSPAMAAA